MPYVVSIFPFLSILYNGSLDVKNTFKICFTVVRCPPTLFLTSIIKPSILFFSRDANSFINCSPVLSAKIDIFIYPIFLLSLESILDVTD